MKTRNPWKVALLALIGLFIVWFAGTTILGYLSANRESRDIAREAEARLSGKIPERTNPGRITKQAFGLLQTGFSYKSVCDVLGSAGTEMSRSELAGTVTVMYSWTNADGSNMNAMFQNDRMISKAQFGLR